MFLHIIRYLGILLFWPILKKLGYGLELKELIFLGFSGLRGALALVLSLILSFDERVSLSVRDYVLFHTCGISLLTILINGNTTGLLVKYLGL